MKPFLSALQCVILDPVGLLLRPAADHHAAAADHADQNIVDDGILQLQIPEKLMRRMMLSGIWQRYERGQLPSLHIAALQLADLPFVKRWWAAQSHEPPVAAPRAQAAAVIARCISRHRSHFREDPAMAQLLHLLRHQPHVKLVCAMNATRDEICDLTAKFAALFACFDTTVVSGEEGVGKPSQRFMQIALQKAGIHPHACHTCMYLDAHDMQSIVAARSLGMHALLVQPHLLFSISNTAMEPSQYSAAHPLHNIALAQRILLAIDRRLQSWSPLPPLSTLLFDQDSVSATFSRDSCITSVFTAAAAYFDFNVASAQKFLFEKREQEGGQEHQLGRAIQFPSLTSEGIRIWDNFAQFLIADLLDDAEFLPMQSPPTDGLICFVDARSRSVNPSSTTGLDQFLPSCGHTLTMSDASTFKDIPQDLDTTSIGLSVLHKFGKVGMDTINKVLDKMLKYVSRDDGILQVYFDSERPLLDPVVVVNAIYLFHLANRGEEVEESELFVQSVLEQKAYEEGTLYYNLGEAFLLHVARLVNRFEEHFTRSGMRDLLRARLLVEQHMALSSKTKSEDAMRLAMRLRAYYLCGLAMREREARELVQLQRADGSWDCHPYYRYGSNMQSWIGNEGLTTAYSLIALNYGCVQYN